MSDSGSVLDVEALRRILLRLESTDVDELEVDIGETHLYIKREPGRRTAVFVPGGAGSGDRTEGTSVGAPLTGVFYVRPGPDQPPFVEVGSSVVPGQVVGLIETMKLFNEVVTELGGEVTSIDVQDGDLVEAGQPLIHIRTREETT